MFDGADGGATGGESGVARPTGGCERGLCRASLCGAQRPALAIAIRLRYVHRVRRRVRVCDLRRCDCAGVKSEEGLYQEVYKP